MIISFEKIIILRIENQEIILESLISIYDIINLITLIKINYYQLAFLTPGIRP